MTDTAPIPGRTHITARALGAVATGVAASVLGVPAGRVRTEIGDINGALALSVTAPLRTGSLRASARTPPVTLLERAESAREEIAERVAALAARRVGRVDLSFNAAEIREPGRVQ
ncbi:hypothetical protein [Mycetocola spongiae]|uniref:hypothetical protein n=1 Tax=Mycetocola spongiae TaxID=2859226 RepID=UPI001CF10A44|nr:hypothetical protein [Mycetocola spongiae]UCR88117.1 hypothetical protein KXZ72_08910 [Mycetocola spongiae]